MDSSDDNMQNATLISNLPPPMTTSSSSAFTTSVQKTEKRTPEVGSYMDLIKELDINKMKNKQQMQQQMQPITPPPQMQTTPPQMQTTPSQMQMTPQMQMQQQMPQNVMQQMQQNETTYNGSMPQSAPTSISQIEQFPQVQQSPLISNLLPDPMFFQPPPPPLPPKREKPVVIESVKKSPFNFDMAKIKPALLVTVIVFFLLSYGAPMLARRLAWTVDVLTGKFTSSGLILLSLITGGVFLGITELIRNYGS